MSLAMAGGIGALVALGSPWILGALGWMSRGAPSPALAEARAYLAVTLAASPSVFLAMTLIATLQAGGDTRTPLAIGIATNAVHVGLNRVFILGLPALSLPALGARGAGISTAITFTLQAALAAAALASRQRPVSLRRPSAASAVSAALAEPLGREGGALARVAIPALFERILYHVGYLGYVVLIARLGDAAMAANQALISVESICFLSGDGFGIAAAALVAQRLGAGRRDDARRAAWIAARDAALTLTVFGVLAFLFRRAVLPVFSDDPDVVARGLGAMPVLAMAQPFMGAGLVLAQALRGAGRTREVLVVMLASAIVVRLSATYALAIVLHLGLVGVWLGSTFDWMVRTSLLASLVWRGRALRAAEAQR